MSFVDLIEAKKRGSTLTAEQLGFAVDAFVAGDVPDYQMAAFLMAVRWRGLSADETSALTLAMIASGERWDFDDLGPTVDKHSTGGVGDKVSLALAPLAASAGCLVPMVSGRGLGHTGGTLDKLESIPGFRTSLSRVELRAQIERIGVAMGAQTDDLVPADRLLYALRDVTATVDEAGLITASILSKKLAEGARFLVLDVKVGSGAFCTDLDAARRLADRLLEVAGRCGQSARALLTDMDRPLGLTIGNACEVREALAVLRGDGPPDVTELVVALTAEMLQLAGIETEPAAARQRVETCLGNGSGLERMARLVEAQGGDPRVCDDPDLLPQPALRREVGAPREGTVVGLDALLLGRAAVQLGAGRAHKDDEVDPAAGLVLHVRPGDRVAAGQPWITLEYGPAADVDAAQKLVETGLVVGPEPAPERPLILETRG